MYCIIAQFVVTPGVSERDFEWLLQRTPAHIVVILFENFASAVPIGMLQDAVRAHGRFRDDRLSGGAVLAHKDRLARPTWVSAIHQAGGFYESFKVDTVENYFNCATSLTVAVMCRPPAAVAAREGARERFSKAFLDEVGEAVKKEQVRFMAGVFDDNKEDIDHLCKPAVAEPVFQPWWKPQLRRDWQ